MSTKCKACEIEANDEQVKQMPMHVCGKDGPVEFPEPKQSNEKDKQEESPYFDLHTNDYGKKWLMYNPGSNGRYNCWLPIDDKFYTEFDSLRSELAKQKELNAELVSARKTALQAMRAYSTQQLKEYKEVIRELLPLAEIGQGWYPGKAALIDRAKKLLEKQHRYNNRPGNADEK